MNKVLKYLIIADVIFLSGVTLVSPVIAIFINDKIVGGSIFAAGLAVMIVCFVKAAVIVPLGIFNDRERGNRREFITLVLGLFIMSLVPIGYIFIHRIEHYFLLQIVDGIGAALYYPGWYTIWTRFVDGYSEGRTWAIYGSLTSLAMGITAFVGGYVAQFLGFHAVFIIYSMFTLISIIFILLVRNRIYGWSKA
ncbi:MAG: MFS transporter [Patescibacteria group bacterium]|nr:MFS transporter [Patescibacteria group bacterium]